MSLIKAYNKIRKSIIAFTPKYTFATDPENIPEFPPIIGTGFIVREDGLIATNDHVARIFPKLPQPPDAPDKEWPVNAIYLCLSDKGMGQLGFEVLAITTLSIDVGRYYYGPERGPDLAFVQVKAKGLPAVEIDDSTSIEEGLEVATAGYPMGTDALTAPGWLHQITPFLQKGIISAVQPFVCPTPHSYSIDVMTQGGASGSPVFSCETGQVLGVLNAGLVEPKETKKGDYYNASTSHSYVVPSHYIKKAADEIPSSLPDDAKSLKEMIDTYKVVNLKDKGQQVKVTKLTDFKK